MADWQTEARKAAARYGFDPDIFTRQIQQESGFDPTARSKAGALGIAQIMPGTARDWGVDPLNPRAALNAAAQHMAAYLKQYGSVRNALVAYNAGPGRVGGALPAETQEYINIILGGKGGGGRPAGTTTPAPATTSNPDPVSSLTASSESAGPRTDATALIQLASQVRQPQGLGAAGLPAPAALPAQYRSLGAGAGPKPRRDVGALINAARTPGQEAADVAAQASPVVAEASTQTAATPTSSRGGASAALAWAQSKVGQPGSRETTENHGRLADYLNSRFGMSGQPWCAMFTSAAVTKGGAPGSARTASVAEVRRQAQQGGGGYQKGFVSRSSAQPGDLILFGNDHIGMVQSVGKNGRISYVGGNQSDNVTQATTTAGDIVRPRYGAR